MCDKMFYLFCIALCLATSTAKVLPQAANSPSAAGAVPAAADPKSAATTAKLATTPAAATSAASVAPSNSTSNKTKQQSGGKKTPKQMLSGAVLEPHDPAVDSRAVGPGSLSVPPGGPQCWLCSDYALDFMDEIGVPRNDSQNPLRKTRHLHQCNPYDPSKPDGIYGSLVPKLPGFKCFVFHEDNRTGKVVMRGMLPLEDLRLFHLEENGCKENVASGELLEHLKFYACSCETDKCNANSARKSSQGSPIHMLIALLASTIVTILAARSSP